MTSNVNGQPPSPLALTRSRRPNAGAKMNQLMTNEEKDKGDEFYATTYGGFAEEEDDVDYDAKSDSNDDVDSDFDLEISDGDDEGENDQEAPGGSQKKRRRDEDYEEDEEEAERRKKRKAQKRKRLSTPGIFKYDEAKKSKKVTTPGAPTSPKKSDDVGDSSAASPKHKPRKTLPGQKRSALRTSTRLKSEMGEARRKVEHAIVSRRKEERSKVCLFSH